MERDPKGVVRQQDEDVVAVKEYQPKGRVKARGLGSVFRKARTALAQDGGKVWAVEAVAVVVEVAAVDVVLLNF